MKLSTITFGASLLLASSLASAKLTTVTGTYATHDPERQTISIVKDRTGELTTYRYADEASFETAFGRSLELSAFEKGEPITLKLRDQQN